MPGRNRTLIRTHGYNFCRVHKTLRCTPAMEARLDTTVRSLEWIVGLDRCPRPEAAAPEDLSEAENLAARPQQIVVSLNHFWPAHFLASFSKYS